LVSVAAITVRDVTDTNLEAEVELVASSREAEGAGVKAATYHQLRVEQRPTGGVETRVLLDV
jgi:SHS2 domain-containing protein